ncbi:MAG: class I SAM-dependent methyltransferase, partial [Euryarchaeota archaeon]|nr:class I SAM-dependent methyltransferase [Euryarchaeota archaeon]
MNQDNIFFDYEGDNWFKRNQKSLLKTTEHDFILDMIRSYNIIPRAVLEIGASNGWRLNEIYEIYGSKCTAVEPSELAIKDGRERYPHI